MASSLCTRGSPASHRPQCTTCTALPTRPPSPAMTVLSSGPRPIATRSFRRGEPPATSTTSGSSPRACLVRSPTALTSPGRQICRALRRGCIWSSTVAVTMCGSGRSFTGTHISKHNYFPTLNFCKSFHGYTRLTLYVIGFISSTTICSLSWQRPISATFRDSASLSGRASKGNETPPIQSSSVPNLSTYVAINPSCTYAGGVRKTILKCMV